MIKPMFTMVAALIAMPVLAQDAAPTLPKCSAKVTDGCQQTTAQEARAMSGEQADRRDSANAGNWKPNGAAGAGATGGRIGMIRGKLAAADTNLDGELSREEWLAAGMDSGNFDALDLDGNGSVTRDELRVVRAELRAGVADARTQMIAADTDKDGKWSKSEWTAIGLTPEGFAALDTNKDGYVSKAEVKAGKQKALKAYDKAMASAK
ncbi:MAG: EF-hand domain-containing protein [Polymorphobacter sp.]